MENSCSNGIVSGAAGVGVLSATGGGSAGSRRFGGIGALPFTGSGAAGREQKDQYKRKQGRKSLSHSTFLSGNHHNFGALER